MVHKWQSQDLNPGHLVQNPGILNHDAVLPLTGHLSLPSFLISLYGSVTHERLHLSPFGAMHTLYLIPPLRVLSHGTCGHVKWHFL